MIREDIVERNDQVLKVNGNIVDGYHGELIRLIKLNIERLILTGKNYSIAGRRDTAGAYNGCIDNVL